MSVHLLKVDREADLRLSFVFTLKTGFINGLTFVYGSNSTDVERTMTSGYNADSNIQKHRNVKLLGDYDAVSGEIDVAYEWVWQSSGNKLKAYNGWKTVCNVRISVTPIG